MLGTAHRERGAEAAGWDESYLAGSELVPLADPLERAAARAELAAAEPAPAPW